VIEVSRKGRRGLVAAGVVCLIAVFFLQLWLSVRRTSQTWDEGDHIFAGYMSWVRGDFGLNPEHPPLVKLVATAPLLPLKLNVPKVGNRYFKTEAFEGGREFVFGNDPDMILARTRTAASLFALALLVVVFLAAREMFGTGAGFLALTLLVFEPNLLAHAAYVTTDTALSFGMFATVYAFYRYVKAPSVRRLAVTGLAAGVALGAKHTGILVFPILALLLVCEALVGRGEGGIGAQAAQAGKRALKLVAPLVVAGLIAVAVLWACYGFRYRARPAGTNLVPPLAGYVQQLKPAEAKGITQLAKWHVLPESYLYGLTDVRSLASWFPSYIFGKVYSNGVWYYFPVAFAVKSTLALFAFLLLAAAAIVTRRLKNGREILFLTVPPLFHLAVAMSSGLNIGVRHILPLYVFFSVLVAGAAWAFIRVNRRWAYVVGTLLAAHVVSSAACFPNYLAYANELWGGPSNTYKYLSDSNTDWAQQLKSVKKYVDARGVKDCWFAYFAAGVVRPSAYGIPCKTLPTVDSMWMDEPTDVPPVIDGPVLISLGTLSGGEGWGGALNPYQSFQNLQPAAVIDHGIFVFDGRFNVGRASARSRAQQSEQLLRSRQVDQALAAAQAAVAADPNVVEAQAALGDALWTTNRRDEARAAYRKGLEAAQTIEPAFQKDWIGRIQSKLRRP
jgi:4-amino-4-deoxy-L-arabinose transferase-like glycosyltransferase